jgi:hypothetical protein
MGELTARIINGIDGAKEFNDFKDWIWMAGDLLRKSHGPGFHSGFEEIDREDVTEAEGQALKDAALRALTRNCEPMYVHSFLAVLRDSYDRDLSPLWIEYLTKYLALLKQSNAIVFTILLALKDIDEPVFEGAKSLCAIDVERNIKEAQEYLRKHGILIPG